VNKPGSFTIRVVKGARKREFARMLSTFFQHFKEMKFMGFTLFINSLPGKSGFFWFSYGKFRKRGYQNSRNFISIFNLSIFI
jgi:hypothetical protein